MSGPMPDPTRLPDPMPLTCADVDELAALYVIDALSPQEAAAVAAHLATCSNDHPSIAELAPLAPALGLAADPVDAPDALRARVLAAIASTPQVPDALPASLDPAPSAPGVPDAALAPTRPLPEARRPTFWQRLFSGGGNRGWLAAAAAGLVLILVGVGLVSALQRNAEESRRLQLLATAVQHAASGDANVATLTGSGSAAGAAGFAVFPSDAPGFIVIGDLPPAPTGHAYQAWYIADGTPASAGLIERSDDGLGTLTGLVPIEGTSVVALTVELVPGVDAPTTDPVVAGELPVPA